MNSITIRRYINTNVGNLGGYQKPYIVIVRILNHKNGRPMKPNMVAFKYPDFKKMLTQLFISRCLILQ
jgi:hypothetical protein